MWCDVTWCDVMWCVMCDVWCVMCDVMWCLMSDIWCDVISDVWCDVCCVMCDVICDVWCDVWRPGVICSSLSEPGEDLAVNPNMASPEMRPDRGKSEGNMERSSMFPQGENLRFYLLNIPMETGRGWCCKLHRVYTEYFLHHIGWGGGWGESGGGGGGPPKALFFKKRSFFFFFF